MDLIHTEIIEKFLKPLNPDVDDLALLNMVNLKLAQMVTMKRIKMKETQYQNPRMVNYYAINFADSGGGKDRPIDQLNDYLFSFLREDLEKKNKEWREQELNEFDIANMDIKGQKESQFLALRKQKELSLRDVQFEFEKATEPALFVDAKTLDSMQFGCMCVRISELGDCLYNPLSSSDMMSCLKRVYEGTFLPTSLKSENKKSAIYNIPVNCIMYSDIDNIIGEKAGIALNTLFSTGLARRSFITFSPPKPLELGKDPLAEREIENRAYYYGKYELMPKLKAIYDKLEINKEFILTDEAFKIYYNYKQNNKSKYNELLEAENKVMKKEVHGRFWKTLKLSTILAACNHPHSCLIQAEDVEQAISMSERFAESFSAFIGLKGENELDKLFNYLKSNKNIFVSRTEMRKQKFVPDNQFVRWLESCAEDIDNYSADYNLAISYLDGNYPMYCLYDKRYQFVSKIENKRERGKLVLCDISDREVGEEYL